MSREYNKITYKVTLVWDVRNENLICDANYKYTCEIEIPYTDNSAYILAYSYMKLLELDIKTLPSIPALDDVYLVSWELVKEYQK